MVEQKAIRVLCGFVGKKIAIGVSGGRDSVCLLHVVLSCGIFDRADIKVVHVNHCLRGIDSDGDEKFVQDLCGKLGVKFYSYRVDVKKASASSSRSIEHEARELRYEVFRNIIKQGEAEVVLTAHHALDNAESVLMHLFRGAGLDGLRGIKKTSGYTVRPFIDVYPEELDVYVKNNGIEYVVDKTNFEADADRNFIRLNILPLIQERYAGAVRAINALACECDDICEYLDTALDRSNIGFSYGAVTVSDAALESSLASRYVRKAAAYFSSVDLTRDMVENAVALKNKKTGSVVDLNNGVKAIREYGCIAIFIPRPACDAEYPLKLGANFIDGLAVDVKRSNADCKTVRGGALDLDKLNGATLRFRRDGDYFTPFGGKKKKLKQYFIDKKIGKRLRDRTPLIVRGNEVLVVVGVEISDSVKQTDSTRSRAVTALRW